MRHPESYYPTQRDVDDYDDEPTPDNETWSLMNTPEGLGWERIESAPVEVAVTVEYRRAA